jgi:hypothetical protein
MKRLLPDGIFGSNEYETVRLHAADETEIRSLTDDFNRELMKVRPYTDSDGIEHAENLISIFYNPSVEWSWLRKKLGILEQPQTYSFEMWFSDGKLRFYISTPNGDVESEIRSQIGGLYPNARTEDANRLLPVIPDNAYLAGGEFDLAETVYAPIRSFSGPDSFDIENDSVKSREVGDAIDPYKSITSGLKGHDSEGVMVQIMFRPAPDEWTNGRGLGQPSSELVARGLQQGLFVDSWINPRIEDPTEKQRKTGEYIGDVPGRQAFDIEIRYFVFDPDRENAIRHAKRIENEFTTQYNNDEVVQQFTADRYDADQVREMLLTAGRREMTDRYFPATKGELAALAHIPDDDIDTDSVNWIRSAFGGTAPGDANKKSKDYLAEKNTQEMDETFAEADEYPENSRPETDETLYEKAKKVVSRSDDAYYRSDIQASDYP